MTTKYNGAEPIALVTGTVALEYGVKAISLKFIKISSSTICNKKPPPIAAAVKLQKKMVAVKRFELQIQRG